MDGPADLLGLDSADFSALASRLLPSGSGIAGRLYAQAFATGAIEPERFGAAARSAAVWREHFTVGLLDIVQVVEEESELGLTSKAVLATADGSRIECVRLPTAPRADGVERATLCISSQVGCRRACAFCETGRAGLARSLSAAEIVSQYLTARLKLGWSVRNIVFMGMGEPLDALPSVAAALRVFTDPRGPAIAWERLTLCSSCPPGGLEALRGLGHKRLNLSISLNAGTDATRSALMPVNRELGMAALAAAVAAYPQRRNFVLGVNYCLIPGVNDAAVEAKGVGAFCAAAGRAIVNLIPYNPGSRPLARAPTQAEIERFEGELRAAGCDVRRRATRGAGIMAGCGQLGGLDRT